ncbi:uncharacterized protein PAC_15514 [Phialocephala subalpina]|uniref:Uncharacterized protein n=1 Tax=Phialocephala subalpina TaxID=576137 RepID=A0A1L7XKS9_9HELO|nr:uncharacterized protein PAC_15514 [Phialocephala subalpina]
MPWNYKIPVALDESGVVISVGPPNSIVAGVALQDLAAVAVLAATVSIERSSWKYSALPVARRKVGEGKDLSEIWYVVKAALVDPTLTVDQHFEYLVKTFTAPGTAKGATVDGITGAREVQLGNPESLQYSSWVTADNINRLAIALDLAQHFEGLTQKKGEPLARASRTEDGKVVPQLDAICKLTEDQVGGVVRTDSAVKAQAYKQQRFGSSLFQMGSRHSAREKLIRPKQTRKANLTGRKKERRKLMKVKHQIRSLDLLDIQVYEMEVGIVEEGLRCALEVVKAEGQLGNR